MMRSNGDDLSNESWLAMDETRIPLAQATALALEVVGMLGDFCERIAMGGSIRRGRTDIGDIEIVAKPYFEGKTNLLNIRLDQLLKDGVLSQRLNKNGHRIAWANRVRCAMYKGFALDVFIVLPDRQWGPTMVIRTGPGDANAALVTKIDVLNRQFDVMGVCPVGMQFKDGAIWGDGGSPYLDTPEEADVFAALGLPWIPPHLRTPGMYRRWRFVRHIPKFEMAKKWDGEFATKSYLPVCGNVIDGVYLPEWGEYTALQWAEGHGPRPSIAVEEAKQLSMFEKAVEYG